ncbi:signal recognition particle protein [Purpureocillium lavendulum]|uniref:DNA mismatch repair protein PMS1 n=1 Tax=Purpureocillium lavendulum TaxID=1247861 RepID=A0AB34G026_9HYPO|nr:signal recognition particle protein [Purpureocillium lavendulum]
MEAGPTMAATIKPIDSRSVHQIQSGQVIVDLCSVVKELVENSIDSGASIIDVRFKNQGLDLIEVQDNGSGIAPANYGSIALKHHTSKLSSYSDIALLQTFGFRGEALASLCALSNLTITTCLQDDVPKASRLSFESTGKLRDTAIVAAQRGTTVAVDCLFHNLPVRRRELERNVKREWHKAIALLNQYACIQTGIKFSVTQQPTKGKRVVLFSTKGNPTTRDNIINIFGAKTLSALVPLDLELQLQPSTSGTGHHPDSVCNKVRIVGHVSRPSHGDGRQTPDRQMFFVNARPCGLPQFAKAFNEVYKSYNYSQSPFILADIQLDTHMYDVNVSPDKRTILLHDQGRLLDTLRSSLTALFDSNDQTIPVSQVVYQRSQQPKEPGPRHATVSPRIQRQVAREDTVVDDIATSDEEEESNDDIDEESDGSRSRACTSHDVAKEKPAGRHKIVPDQNLISQWLNKNSKSTAHNASASSSRRSTRDGGNTEASESAELLPLHPAAYPVEHTDDSSTKLPVRPSEQCEGSDESLTEAILAVDSADGNRLSPPRHRHMALHTDKVVHPQDAEAGKPLPLRVEHSEDENDVGNDEHDGSGPVSTLPPRWRRRSRSFNSGERVQGTHHGPPRGEDVATAEKRDRRDEILSVSGPSKIRGGRGIDLDDMAEPENPARVVLLRPFITSGADIPDRRPGTPIAASRATSMSAESRAEPGFPNHGDSLSRPGSADPETVKSDQKPSLRDLSSIFGTKRTDSTVSTTRWLRVDEETVWLDLDRLTSTASTERTLLSEARVVEDITSSDAESKLSLIISREDFSRMRIVGQFNMGFIIAVRPASTRDNKGGTEERDELFIIDQHASDEKYNFERLQASTTVQSQRLVHSKLLQLTALEEEVVMENISAIEANGFKVQVDVSGKSPVGSRCRVMALPLSRETTFTIDDLQELIVLLGEESAESSHTPRPSKVRRMFAMRACRGSIMIGKALTSHQMSSVLKHMGELDKPWNCPHGRPTMRHLCRLDTWDQRRWKRDAATGSVSMWHFYGRSAEGSTREQSQPLSE